MSAKKKTKKQSKDLFERFPPPEIDIQSIDENYLFECSLSNNYQPICGAFDVKEHPLASFVIEKNLFNKRDEFGKTVFDLAAYCGNKEFIKAILDRTNEKERIDENVLNLRNQLRPDKNAYNFMHFACIWNQKELVKYLAEHTKLIVDPGLEHSDFGSISSLNMKSQIANTRVKTIGSVLLRTKAKTGETPKELAKRYGHMSLVEYLDYAGF